MTKYEPLRRFLRQNAGACIGALVVNGILGLIAAGVVVAQALRMPEPEFSAVVAAEMPQEPWEQELDWGSAQAGGASAQGLVEQLAVDTASAAAMLLPPALESASEVPQSSLLDGAAQGLLASAGLAGMLDGARTAASAASFFGIEDTGERIVIVANTSASVVRKAQRRGVTIDKIREEVVRLVDGLGPGAQFGLVHFSQGVRLFAPHLAPATPGNRALFRTWVLEGLQGNPPIGSEVRLTGHQAALEAAFALEPDVIFLVTDGQLDRREGSPGAWTYPVMDYREFEQWLRPARRGLVRPTRLHVIGFELSDRDRSAMTRLAREFGGQVRSF